MSDLSFDYSDRVVAVTGGAVGIGAAVASAFAGAGAAVFILDIDEERGTQVAGQTGHVTFLSCDVTAEEGVDVAFGRIENERGRLDVLVNNAGGFWVQRTTDQLSLEEWRRVLDLNLTAVFLTSRRAVPLLRRSGAGRIINVGSLAGQTAGYRTSPPYAAAKAAVHALSRVMAHELAGDGITVNALAPSAVLTDRIRQVRSPEELEATAASIPLGRYQRPDEIASWILFLASDEASYMTGQTIAVNGGRFMS
ncbi:MAG TPA: SDR family NAD(P)-dependent oxidoreductase [Acidimicrobiia bacterium]|nr:SDR family NAD(P)-dependent oxidoreductase [Acidimicrobiia bacterium]